MEEREMLEKFLKYQIRLAKRELKNLPPSNDEKEQYYTSLKDEIREIMLDIDNLVKLDVKKIRKEFPQILSRDINLIILCQKTLEKKYIQLKEYDIGFLRKIFSGINTIINEYLKENAKDRQKYVERIDALTDLLNRINNYQIESKDIDLLYELVSKLDFEESFEIMNAISNMVFENRSLIIEEEQEEENIFEVENNLDENELRNLFEKYGVDYDYFSDKAKKELKKYGNLNKIEDILNAFIECDLPLSESFFEIITDKKTYQLSRVLLASTPDKIKHIIELCKQKGIVKRNDDNEIIYDNDGNTIIDIAGLLKFSSMFISRKVKWQKKKPKGDGPGEDGVQSGCHEDFIENISLFTKLGVDVGKSFEKCGFIFTKPTEHIKLAVKNFELYGIGEEQYIQTLSCLRAINQCDVLDQSIELGYFDYMKNALSYVGLKQPYSPMFYKLARLNQLSMPVPKSEKNSRYLKLDVTFDQNAFVIPKKDGTMETIDSNNGPEVTRQFIPTFDRIKEYDYAYNSSSNNTTTLSERNSIIALLDQNYISNYVDKYSNKSYQDIESREIDITKYHEIIEKSKTACPMVYNIAGVQISRLKVLRIYDTLIANGLAGDIDSIMYAITKNSIFTKEQYDQIYVEIESLLKPKRSMGI